MSFRRVGDFLHGGETSKYEQLLPKQLQLNISLKVGLEHASFNGLAKTAIILIVMTALAPLSSFKVSMSLSPVKS